MYIWISDNPKPLPSLSLHAVLYYCVKDCAIMCALCPFM